jgi:hypothetical protein
MERMVREGFLRKDHQNQLLVSHQIHSLLEYMDAYEPPTVAKWIGLE